MRPQSCTISHCSMIDQLNTITDCGLEECTHDVFFQDQIVKNEKILQLTFTVQLTEVAIIHPCWAQHNTTAIDFSHTIIADGKMILKPYVASIVKSTFAQYYSTDQSTGKI